MAEGDPLYITDPAGVVWRVHDVAYGYPPAAPGVTKRLELGDPRAHYRAFVTAEGVKRLHRFAKGEGRDIEPETLARQLHSAGWAHRGKKFDPATWVHGSKDAR